MSPGAALPGCSQPFQPPCPGRYGGFKDGGWGCPVRAGSLRSHCTGRRSSSGPSAGTTGAPEKAAKATGRAAFREKPRGRGNPGAAGSPQAVFIIKTAGGAVKSRLAQGAQSFTQSLPLSPTAAVFWQIVRFLQNVTPEGNYRGEKGTAGSGRARRLRCPRRRRGVRSGKAGYHGRQSPPKAVRRKGAAFGETAPPETARQEDASSGESDPLGGSGSLGRSGSLGESGSAAGLVRMIRPSSRATRTRELP